jgi:hypothetical protein
MSESRTPARKLFVEVLESRDVPSVEFPAGANVVDLAARYGAIPNDGVDDTAAVQAAVNDWMARDTILYFRDGVYDFSAPIDYALAGRGERGLWLQGQSQAGTVFRWADNLAVFNQLDAQGNRVGVPALDLYNGNSGNAFGNYIHDLTVDVGAGNPGATGVQYHSNNYGSMRNLTIRTSDPQKAGYRGLDIIFNEPGPWLAANLTIDGFDAGVLAGPQSYSAVFDGLTLTNQREYGFANYRLPVSITNFTSINTVPAYIQLSSFGWGNTVITNAQFIGGDANTFAVVNENDPTRQGTAGTVFLRNVTTSGYRGVIDDRTAGRQVLAPSVTEYVTQNPLSLHPTTSPQSSLNLPVEATPVTPADPVANWVSVQDFGANPWDELDDSDAIQRALDSGAKTVYFPNPFRVNPTTGQFEGGAYRVGKTLVVGGNVQRVAGLYSQILIEAPLFNSDAALFRVVDGNRDLVQIDGFTVGNEGGISGGRWHSFGHDSTATLVIKDMTGGGYRNAVRGGKVFVENYTGSDFRFRGQQVWMRQFNPEETVDRPKIVNDGGDLWILGLKIEGRSTQVNTVNGGRTEILGGQIYTSWFVPADFPAFTTADSSLSFSLAESSYIYQGNYNVWVRDTRNGVTRDLSRANTPIDGSRLASNIGLYTDRIADATAPGVPTNLRVSGRTTNGVTLTWDSAAEPDSFVRAYRVYRNGAFIGATAGTVFSFTDAGRPDGTAATYTVLAENAAGLRGAPTAGLTTATLADTTRPAPVVATATPYRGNQVVVTFTEPLAVVAASNFVIDNGVAVTAAALSADGKTVTLTTSPLTAGTPYTLTLSGLTDRATTPNAVVAGTAVAFGYRDTAGGIGLTGSYYPTNNFTGTPVSRTDPVVDFDWGNGAPGVPGLGADNFSVRWTGQIEARYSEVYTFTMAGDDRITLRVHGQTVIDRQFYSPNESTGTIRLEAGRRYDIEVTVAEDAGGAGARLWWQSASQPREIVPAAQLFPTAQFQTVTVRTGFGRGADTRLQITDGGVLAEYFANNSTSGTPVFSRTEGIINSFWGTGGPGGGVPTDNFSVRYTGFVLPNFTEDYTFTAVADDRVRLWVNGQLIINRNFYTAAQTDSTPIRLTAGVPASIRMEVEEDFGGANAVLFWRSASTVQNWPTFLPPTSPDDGASGTTGTVNRLNFSFAGSMIGLRFDLSGLDLANFRLIDAGLGFTVAAPTGGELSLQTVSGVNDDAGFPLWAETAPDRVRWATFPGNAAGNYSFGGSATTSLGTMVADNTGFRLNGRQDATQFTSEDLLRFLQADTDGLVSFMLKRKIPAFFGDFNVYTKEFGDGSFAPSLRLVLAPKVTDAPLGVDLLSGWDTGGSDADDRTARNNASPAQALRFRVSGTTVGATVTIYADGVAIGSAVATGDTTEVLTLGNARLLDGVRTITARQTVLGEESADSAALPVTIDTATPRGTLAAVSPNPRNTPVDTLTLTFTEPVTGVDLSDFVLNGTPLNLTAATLTGGGTTYTLGNLAGLTAAEGVYSLVLLAGGSGIADAAGNLLAANALVGWGVDLTPPRPTVTPVAPALRNAPVTSVAIGFSEAVTGFDLGDITLTLNGAPVSLAGATLTGSGNSYTLGNLTGLTAAEGEYVLTLNPAGSGITDAAGNEMTDAAGTQWQTDTTAPTAGFADVTPDPRTTPVPSIALTFSEAITGLDLGDLLLTRNGVAVDLTGATLTNSGNTYNLSGLTAATTAAGTYVLSVRATGTGIADAAGNALAGAAEVQWVTAAAAGPRVASVRRLDPNPTSANEVRFEVTFTEAVTGVDIDDFHLHAGGGLTEVDLLEVDGSGAVYTVTAGTGENSGTLRLDVIDDDTITGATGAKLGGIGVGNGTFRRGEVYTIDRTAPRVTGISSVTPNPRRTPVDSLTVTFSELLNVATLDASDLTLTRDGGENLIGAGVTVTQTGPRTFRVDGLTALTAASGRYVFTVNAAGVTDVAGNAGSNSLSRNWTRETPRVMVVERVNANPTNAASVTYRVTLSEAVTGLDAADFRLAASSGLSGTAITGVTAISGNQYLVTVNTGIGSGTLRLDFLAAGSGVNDLFGNAVTADYTRGQVYTIDRNPPTVRSIAGVGSTTTSAVPSLVVTFSEAINPATFTTANLFLRRNGVTLDVSGLTIVQLTPTTFRIDGLESLTSELGQYEFGVNWAGIADPLGNAGTGTRLLRWAKTA